MKTTYWGDPVWDDLCGSSEINLSHPAEPYQDGLASLPQSTSLMIELDLQGTLPPRFLPLYQVSEPQRPETAQIFLCTSSMDARLIFQHCKIKHSTEYMEQAARNKRSFLVNNVPGINEEISVPYDPRCVHDWLSIQPEQVHKILLHEYVRIPSEPRSDHLAVRSQVHMTRGTENRYMAVWFDFRDAYKLDGKLAIAQNDNVVIPEIPASTWQRQFASRFRGLPNGPIRYAMDFPNILLLEILSADITAFEKFVWIDHNVLPVATHVPVVTESFDKRLGNFELTQSMIQKAEDINRLVAHMISLRVLDLLQDEARSSSEKTLNRLELGSSLLISELERRDKLADKRLDINNRFAQLQQASSLSALTYCAAFFLPLSLAATFLSMQTRAKALKLLAFDFTGMTLLFCTVAALVYYASGVVMSWKKRYLDKRLETGHVPRSVVHFQRFMKTLLCFYWIMLVFMFFSDMLIDGPGLGIYTSVAIAGLGIIVLGIIVYIWMVSYLPKLPTWSTSSLSPVFLSQHKKKRGKVGRCASEPSPA